MGNELIKDPIILNLGCGSKTSPQCINIDWTIGHRLARHAVIRKLVTIILDERQKRTLQSMYGRQILVHNLRKGIPFPDSSVDAVYHSHILEHIDRDGARPFLREILRVLKPNAVVRIVVPDLERLVKAVAADYDQNETTADWRLHEAHIEEMIEQMVRREPGGRNLSPARRRLDRFVSGDARKRGETHQWMYDRINLPAILTEIGFVNVRLLDLVTSGIPNWQQIGLDLAADGVSPHKPGSIYVEALKPATN